MKPSTRPRPADRGRSPARGPWWLLSVLGLLGALACGRGEAPRPQGPNVLLVTIDTLRADHLGAYGFGLDTSPGIDALAAGGVLFERAIAGAASTAPSHTSIMTSRYTREHSVGYMNGETRLVDTPTLADAFHEAGYATAGFVGNFFLKRRLGLDRGFDVYDDELQTAERNREGILERKAEDTARRAIAWLESVGERPFFLWVHFQDPHGPYDAPSAYRGRFVLRPVPGEQRLRVLDDESGEGGIPAYQAFPGLALPSLYELRYAEEIAYADHWIGELVAAAEARSAERGVVVLLTADHGESMGEEQRWFVHGSATTPDQAHVPMLLRAPGLPAARVRGVVHHVDVMPTLLELAGLPPPARASGIALAPLLRSGAALPSRVVYCDNGARLTAYGPHGFLRVLHVGGAWKAENAGPMAPSWSYYSWEGGDWHRSRAAGPDREPVRAYFRHSLPMVETAPIPPGLLENLRALGYTASD